MVTTLRERNANASLISLKRDLQHRVNFNAIEHKAVLAVVKIKEPDAYHLHDPGRRDGSCRSCLRRRPEFGGHRLSSFLKCVRAMNKNAETSSLLAGLENTAHRGPWYEGTAGERIAVRLSSIDTNGAYAIVESVIAPGCSPPMHLHRNEEEHFVVLAGIYRILIEDKMLDAPVGTSTTVPRGARHSWRNISNETSRLLVILTPGGFEKCIQTIRDSPADKILEIAARYGCFIVGPPISI